MQMHTSCAVEEEGLPARILDDHDRSIVILQAAGDLGRTSLQDCHILCLYRLTTSWGREKEKEGLKRVRQRVNGGEENKT